MHKKFCKANHLPSPFVLDQDLIIGNLRHCTTPRTLQSAAVTCDNPHIQPIYEGALQVACSPPDPVGMSQSAISSSDLPGQDTACPRCLEEIRTCSLIWMARMVLGRFDMILSRLVVLPK